MVWHTLSKALRADKVASPVANLMKMLDGLSEEDSHPALRSDSSGSHNSSEYLMAACYTHRVSTPVFDSVPKQHVVALRRTLRNLAKVAARASVQLASVDEFDMEDIQSIYTEVTDAFTDLEDCVLDARDNQDKEPTALGNSTPAVSRASSITQPDVAAEIAAIDALCDPDLCANPITPRARARYISMYTGDTGLGASPTRITHNQTPASSVTEFDTAGDIAALDALCDPNLCAHPMTPRTRARYVAVYTGDHIVPTSDPTEVELTLPVLTTPRSSRYVSRPSPSLASTSYRADISTPIFSTRK